MKDMTVEMMEAMMAVRNHVSDALRGLADVQREFLFPINPSESPETLEYCRKVAQAIDEVVLVITRSEDNEERRKQLHQATEIMLQNIIEYHKENKGEATH